MEVDLNLLTSCRALTTAPAPVHPPCRPDIPSLRQRAAMHPIAKRIVFPIDRITPRQVEWLWLDRLSAGSLALLDGDPGQGKSLLTLDLAARLTTGRPMPDDQPGPAPCNVILLSSEDNLEQTVLPRLHAAQADLSRIHVFRLETADGLDRPPSFPDDCPLLAETIAETSARLVIIDPLLAFLSPEVFSLNDQGVRRALDPLRQVVEKTRSAILLVRHLIKGRQGQRALYRGSGAIAIIGSCRTASLAVQDPDDPEQRFLAGLKNNYGPLPPTLGYRLSTTPTGQPRIDWTGPVPKTADELVRTHTEPFPEALPAAVTFLQDALEHGPATSETVHRQAQAVGISQRTLHRAKAQLGIESKVEQIDNRNVWYWSLPRDEDSERIMKELFGPDFVPKQPDDP